MLGASLGLLWLFAISKWVNQWLSRWIAWALTRWIHIGVRDYASLLHLPGDYEITEEAVERGDWLANKPLQEAALRDEGVIVVGIQRSDGTYVGAPKGKTRIEEGDLLILYGRDPALQELDQRCCDVNGDEAHQRAMGEQRAILDRQEEHERVHHSEKA